VREALASVSIIYAKIPVILLTPKNIEKHFAIKSKQILDWTTCKLAESRWRSRQNNTALIPTDGEVPHICHTMKLIEQCRSLHNCNQKQRICLSSLRDLRVIEYNVRVEIARSTCVMKVKLARIHGISISFLCPPFTHRSFCLLFGFVNSWWMKEQWNVSGVYRMRKRRKEKKLRWEDLSSNVWKQFGIGFIWWEMKCIEVLVMK
jgi:hypothetical protein